MATAGGSGGSAAPPVLAPGGGGGAPPPHGGGAAAPAAAAVAHNPTMKIPPLMEATPEAFLQWRRNATLAVALNNFDPQRARAAVAMSIQGEPFRLTSHINLRLHEVPCPPVAEYFDTLQTVFVPESGTQQSRHHFQTAYQLPEETVMGFHSRLRTLFIRAYPNDIPEASPILMDRFIEGLADKEVAKMVYFNQPHTYAECLAAADRLEAGQHLVDGVRSPAGNVGAIRRGRSLPPLPAANQRSPPQPGAARRDLICFNCQGKGHFQSDCPSPIQDRDGFARPAQPPVHNRGGRGRGAARSRGGGRSTPNSNAGRAPPQGSQRRVAAMGRLEDSVTDQLYQQYYPHGTGQEDEGWDDETGHSLAEDEMEN